MTLSSLSLLRKSDRGLSDAKTAFVAVQSSNADRVHRDGEPVNLAIVDDDPDQRALFKRMASRSERLRVVGCYPTGEEALKSLAIAEAKVILMDIRMPGMSGTACTRLLKKLLPASRILMVTVLSKPDDLRQALLAGADGFLNKPLTEVPNKYRIRVTSLSTE